MAQKMNAVYVNPAEVQNRSADMFWGSAVVGIVAEVAANHLFTGDSRNERLGRGALHVLASAAIGAAIVGAGNNGFAKGQIATEKHAARRLPNAPQF